MRRKIFFLFTLIIFCAFLTFCQRNISGNETESAQPKEVRVLLADHPYGNLLIPLIPEFERETGIRVIMEQLNETELNQKLTNEFADGTSAVDVFMTRPLQETLLFLKNGWITPLDEYDFNDYPFNTLEIGIKDDIPYVVPLIVEWQVLYYRKDLFQAAGLNIPANFEELEHAARILNRDGVAGFAARGAGSPAVTQISSFIYNFGGRFLNNGTAVFHDPVSVNAIRLYGRLLGVYGPHGVGTMSWSQLLSLFQAGRLAMWTDASVFYGQLINPQDTQIPAILAENIGVAKMPRGPAADEPYITTAWGMSISSMTRDMDSAMKFLTWATSREMAQRGMLANITMARTSMWNDSSITSQVNPGLVETMIHASQNGYPYDRPFMTSVVTARELIGEVISESINTRGTSPRLQALATRKAAEVDALLKADGEYGIVR